MDPLLALLRDHPEASGLFLDFDGTLADVVARPDMAKLLPEARPVLERLVRSFGVIAVVSGRPSDEARALVGVPGTQIFGLYGLESGEAEPARGALRRALAEAVSSAAGVPGAWVEDKGLSVAVHFREAADPEAAERRLESALRSLAERRGLVLLRGKRVLELAPRETPGKGAVVLGVARRRELKASLYAGDDRADLDAFVAMDELRTEGMSTVKIAVRADETPDELVAAADVVVDGPTGLVELLASLG